MDHESTGGSGQLPFDAPQDQTYRTCTECGGDCVPETTALDGLGVRITFVCPTHGIHSVINPFEDLGRQPAQEVHANDRFI